MRIGFVTSSLGSGGAERVTSILSSEFAKEHTVFVIITSIRQKEVYSCGLSSILYLSEEKRISPLRKINKLVKLINEKQLEILVAFPDPCSYYGAVAAKRCQIPCICSERNAPQFAPTSPLMRFLRKRSYHLATRIVFQTEEAKKYFNVRIQKKGVIIPNPFQKRSPEDRVPSHSLISAGRFTHQKNFPCLIRAFSIFCQSFPDYTLTIFGEGPERKSLERITKKLHLQSKVFFPGFSNCLDQELKKAGIFVMTSNHEGIPNALLEAVAAGVPCVSTDCPVGGPRQLIGLNPKDRLVKVGDYRAVASALKDIATHYEDAEKVCLSYGQKLTATLATEKITIQWLALFTSAIAENKENQLKEKSRSI
jgi:glycosyltransferase involved in cell wall biosynthesis